MRSRISSENIMKYNYVFLWPNSDYYCVSYGDIESFDGAIFPHRRIESDSRLLTNLYRLHTSPKTNRLFKLPFQRLWNPLAFRGGFSDDKPICFIFHPGSPWLRNGIIEYLRRSYPNCRVVIHFTDLVRHAYPKQVDELIRKADLCLSFDHADTKQYGMEYYPLVYSPCNIPEDDGIAESDVYFVGKVKNRLPMILAAYEKLRDAGLKCEFYITGVAPEDQKYADEIHYCGQMSYVENLKHIKKTKCLLEIMQQGGHGYTLRACETIMYDKKMITNNPEISGAPFYRSELISVFDDVEDIDPSFVTAEPAVADYGWKEQLSPVRLLEYIDGRL